MTVSKATRPSGWLGNLYDLVSTCIADYGTDVMWEMERIVYEAQARGIINHKSYIVLQRRIPLPPYKRESWREVGGAIGATGPRVGQLERNIYKKLIMYLTRAEPVEVMPQSSIDILPWSYGNISARALNSLRNSFSDNVTVGDIVTALEDLAQKHKPLTVKNFGKKSAEAMYEAFAKAGIELPQVKVL